MPQREYEWTDFEPEEDYTPDLTVVRPPLERDAKPIKSVADKFNKIDERNATSNWMTAA